MERTSPQDVTRAYFDAISNHDLDAAVAAWADGGEDSIAGVGTFRAPDELRAYWSAVLLAIPDWRFEVLDTIADGERVAVRWRVTGTHTGGPYQGVEPTGARIDARGVDVAEVREGRLVRLEAFPDGLTVARQLGLLPKAGSAGEARLTRAFNAGNRVARRAAAGSLEPVAPGVWLLRGDVLRTMNAYLLEDDGGGVTLFDAGPRQMGRPLATAAATLGGINRIVLSHAHVDHRGGVAEIAMPVWIHAAEREDAEGDAGLHYMHRERLGIPARWVYPRLQRYWDGGPVEVAGTIAEGEEISGFTVVGAPGHAPGQVALFRERDGVLLAADAFTSLNVETGIKSPPRAPHEALSADAAQARESLRRLAELAPASAWPGHGDPIRGDVRAQLERAAAG